MPRQNQTIPWNFTHVLARAQPLDEAASRSRTRRDDLVPGADAMGRLDRLMQLYAEGATVGLAIIDNEFRYVEINEHLAALHGLPRAAHLSRSICSIVPAIGPALTQLVRQTLQTKLPIRDVRLTAHVPFAAGPQREWLASFFPINLSGGTLGVAQTVCDITDRVRLECDLCEIELDVSETVLRESLTPRQAEVLRLIGQGKTTKELAALLSISALTVGNHRKQLCWKLNLHSTAELVSYAAGQLLSAPLVLGSSASRWVTGV